MKKSQRSDLVALGGWLDLAAEYVATALTVETFSSFTSV